MFTTHPRSVVKELVTAFIVVCVFSGINLLIIALSQMFIPYRMNGSPYQDIMVMYHLPPYLLSLTNFDGSHYSLIASHGGYYTYQQAYFPLYPLLMWGLSLVIYNNHPVAGLIISFVSLVGAVYFLNKVVNQLYPKYSSGQNIHPFVLLLLVLPCSFYFSAVYTESLFLLLFSLVLYLLIERKYLPLLIVAFLSSLTRLVGVFLLIPILFGIWEEKIVNKRFVLFMGVAASVLGLVVYMSYLWISEGDPLMFVHTQSIFNSTRSTHIITLPQVIYRYLKIFLTARFDVNYVVALIEFAITFAYLFLLGKVGLDLFKRRFHHPPHYWLKVALLIFSVSNIILPTLTGTLSSLPRYSLLSLSALPVILEWRKEWQWIVVGVSFALHVLMLSLFAQGYFVS